MEELALATGLVVLPVALVARRIDPDHIAATMAQSAFPLACVHGTSAVSVHSILQRIIVLVRSTQRLLRLITLEVLALHLACQLHDSILASLDKATNEGLHANDPHHVLLGDLDAPVPPQITIRLHVQKNARIMIVEK